ELKYNLRWRSHAHYVHTPSLSSPSSAKISSIHAAKSSLTCASHGTLTRTSSSSLVGRTTSSNGLPSSHWVTTTRGSVGHTHCQCPQSESFTKPFSGSDPMRRVR